MKIIIAGGGTGGHIYPAISIAQALKKSNPSTQIIFVGTAQGLETKIIPQAGYDLRLIQSGKLNYQGQFFQKIKSVFKIPLGIIQSVIILIKERPDFVIGVGGYASAPMTLAAALIRVKTAIWEPNAHPGMANRILSRYVDKTYLVFADAVKFLKSKNNITLGMPLRDDIENYSAELSTAKNNFTLLCFGGSQGSMFLNDCLSDFVLNNPQLVEKMHIIHQTGSKDFERIKTKYDNHARVEVHEYIFNMPKYYSQADMLFCRGGASTLAEAAVYGVVPLVVPLPAADDHQQRNAEALVNQNAGFMFLQNTFDSEQFKNKIAEMIKHPEVLQEMSDRLKQMVQKGAARKIAEDIIASVGPSKKESTL